MFYGLRSPLKSYSPLYTKCFLFVYNATDPLIKKVFTLRYCSIILWCVYAGIYIKVCIIYQRKICKKALLEGLRSTPKCKKIKANVEIEGKGTEYFMMVNK